MSFQVLKLARAQYCRWLRGPVGPAGRLRQERVRELRDAHNDDPEFGCRLLADEARQAGFPIANRMAWRLCRNAGFMSAVVKTRKKPGKKPGPAVYEVLVNRNFIAGGPNQLWLVGITEYRTWEGKFHLCTVKDVSSRRIVSYSIADRMKSRIAVDVANYAVAGRCDVTGFIVLSDRGTRSRSRKFLQALNSHGLVGSMGEVDAARDNAAMESFLAMLQKSPQQAIPDYPSAIVDSDCGLD